eukprot:CAMPEP_0203686140 /NCGR_PEP_ID=MMETSP0090-20130426/48909_1 /ASSEMBLY_ACC=CAM_ASM_001088 /TAXON_ID=426623 /ORGANISM="Chaetoceros affinis, Strain CCMP159" /LENGTH=506 /DNA_ID=CAMNT_0050555357 /DNA_START=79 /DNA_END=1599 /DNA_ORIENTATION=-
MAPFTSIFGCTLLLNAAATFRSSSYWNSYKSCFGYSEGQSGNEDENKSSDTSNPTLIAKHGALLKKYLAVYLLSVLSDWLQGPYVYALYDKYGYSQHEIAVLFVAGFGSSMVFGTFIGGLADSCGRKKFTILFALIYIASCVTKHFKDFNILMLGRLLGGVATSLLFSVFDSWLIRSHADAGVTSFLSKSFAAAQYGNSIVAISAGLLANQVASSGPLVPMFADEDDEDAVVYKGGYLNPFDMALVVLVIATFVAATTWDENFGETKEDAQSAKNKRWYDAFTSAFYTTIHSKEILYTGLICSLFEGSMYIFVFMWTPAMQALTDDPLPFGLIFATFMVCCMAGSSIFSVFIGSMKVEKLGVYVLGIATVAFALMTFSSSETGTFMAFLLFEMTVGTYFPTMGTMKSAIVPESKRAAIYNLYRIPLNCIVLFSLLTDLTPHQSFILCTSMLSVATILQISLIKHQQTFFSTSSASQTTKAIDVEKGTLESEPLVSDAEDDASSKEN